jgi:hypothetical protein
MMECFTALQTCRVAACTPSTLPAGYKCPNPTSTAHNGTCSYNLCTTGYQGNVVRCLGGIYQPTTPPSCTASM